jgi:hypothetical protein
LATGSLPEHNVVVQVAVEDGVLVNSGVEPLSCCRLVVANEAAFPPKAFLFQLLNQLHWQNVFVTFNPLGKVDKTFFPVKTASPPKMAMTAKVASLLPRRVQSMFLET